MSIKIGRYNFDGPYAYTSSLDDRSGIYAIIDDRSGTLNLLDVGESATVKSRVEKHERESCWDRNRIGTLKVAVLYTPGIQQSGRIIIEQEIRNEFSPVCGIR